LSRCKLVSSDEINESFQAMANDQNTNVQVQILGTVENYWRANEPGRDGEHLQIFTLKQLNGNQMRCRSTKVNFAGAKDQLVALDMSVNLRNTPGKNLEGKNATITEFDIQSVASIQAYVNNLTPVQAAAPQKQ
jgi:hypothetical protein